ncbi:hypothetical protein [Pseudonocardia sp. WMMC193]|uniref:hypothetical protein n=1 Tax=Pseudonocardia sp. WMMC193 TaxID=2911965 RepID=UPI001F1F3468|nr:hypothetical protein [Pseudonocardia sp. WMMC193]MCF7549212.1 hypothetical protein [Pseudonocardia sp. WMMC193]
MDENPPSRCAVCHGPRTARDVRGLAWSSHHTVAGISWVCGPCTRASLFEIETGLPLAPAPLQKSA